jgi:ATPase subunit of ABC transporter with duplicated ATPase domains
MVKVQNLKKAYGSRVLFEDVNLSLDKGKRYGLIGANGAGKSTFLKILAGLEEPTEGEVIIGSGLKVGVLGQNQYAFEDFTLFDAVLYGNKRLYDAIKEQEKLYMSEEFTDEINEKIGELEMIKVEEDPTYEYDIRITKILEDLGFSKDDHYKLMSEIPNADKFKILLAQVLFPKPDVLFLDEPTNNLDMETISWLENQLQRHEGTMVVISHDRHFLNAVVTNILDVDFKKIREFTGNYDDWYMASTILQKQQQAQREKAEAQKKQLEEFIRRFSANASKAKQATSRQKQLEKLDIQKIELSSRREPSIVFKQAYEIGKEILFVEHISKSFDDKKVLNDINFVMNKGDKIALIGPNGVGKTTLCEILVGNLEPDEGKVTWGAKANVGYFPQNTTDIITGDEKLYDWLRGFKKDAEINDIRNALGRMLFSGEEQEKSIENCSGGEKHRMMLSKLMLLGPNVLILDEPTNHLDLEAIIALGEAIHNYDGQAIVVSHDRDFIDAFANRIIELHPDGRYTDFLGTYEEYRESKNR